MISLVMPCYLRPHLLRWGLYSLNKQHFNFDFEIIILNDGLPNDGTEELCKQYSNLNIRYIFTGQRNLDGMKWQVPGVVYNQGVNLAEGNIIILSGAEIFYLGEEDINKLVYPLLSNSKILVIPEGKDDDKGFFLKELEENSEKTYLLRNMYYNYELKTPLNTKLNFCMAMHKKTYNDIDGFDSAFFEGYCFDDNDFVNRLVKNGNKYYLVNVRIIHLFNSRKVEDRVGLKNRKEMWLKNKKIYEDRWGKI